MECAPLPPVVEDQKKPGLNRVKGALTGLCLPLLGQFCAKLSLLSHFTVHRILLLN